MKNWNEKVFCCLFAAFFMFCFFAQPANAAENKETTVNSWTDLVSAVKDADAGDTIKIGSDIDATTSASLRVSENITVDGQGHTLDGQEKYGFFVTKGGTLTLKNTVLANARRESSKKACAVYAYSGGGANLENCVLYNCADNYSGYGAIYCSSYPLNMTNCTVLANGNGVTIGTTGGTLTGNIFVGNQGTDLIFKSTSSKAKDGGYNLIGTTSSQPSGFASQTSTIDSALSNYSKWINTEGELLENADSPAIDKIPVEEAAVNTDIYGTARPQGEKVDIGAIEYEAETKAVTEIKVTKAPTKTDYIEGQSFNKAGMEVTAYYEDGSSRAIRTYTYDAPDKLTTDIISVTVTYAGKTCEVPITVSSRSVIDSAEKLKEALTTASDGDTLSLAGDITLDSSWESTGTPLTVSKSVTIDGNGYTIDGAGKYAFLDAGKNITLKVQNLVLTNLYASDDGAAINVDSKMYANIEMRNCIVRENKGYHGIIYSRTGNIFIDHCTFMNNEGGSTSTSSTYGLIYSYTSGSATVQNSILVNNTSTNKNGTTHNDIYGKSVAGDYNIIGTPYSTTWKTGDNNKIDESYNKYRLWMSEEGKLYYPPLSSAGNPAVDINAEEKPEGVLSEDIYGNVRSQGKGSDAGAVETSERNAATPKLTKNLTADTDSYVIGDKAKDLEIKADIDDDGTLSYEWYYIDYIDAVTTATVQIEDAHDSTYTPPTSSVGERGYFAIAYNTNENDPYINGKNGVIDKTNADTRRATAIYAISETHQVDVDAGDLTITGISVTKAPTKTTYVEGQEFDRDGMEVVVNYSNGVTYPLTGYTTSPASALTTDTKEITISYEGFTTTQPITVVPKAVTSLEITTPPTKTDYAEGESFDTTGMIVTATYNDETTAPITDYEVVSGDKLTKDVKEITISCKGENGKTITTTQPITVGINDVTQLRRAIENAAAGATLKLTNTIVMNDEKGAIVVDKNITIDGCGYEVDGKESSTFICLEKGSLSLKNMYIHDMVNEEGGAVIDSTENAADLSLENCVVASNKGAMGAIDFAPTSGTAKIYFSTIIANQSGAVQKTTKSTVNDGVAGGVNIGSKAQLQMSSSIVTGNSFYRKNSFYDVNVVKPQVSGGNNLIGVENNLTATETDKVGKEYSVYSSWMKEDGTPVKSSNSPVTLVARSEELPVDMRGNARNEQTAIGALELQEKTVAQIPTITENLPESKTVKEGEKLVLSVKAEGNGTLTYQWYKDSQKIENADKAEFIIDKVTTDDSGSYGVVVTNTIDGTTAEQKSTICKLVVEKNNAPGTTEKKDDTSSTTEKKDNTSATPAKDTITTKKQVLLLTAKKVTNKSQTLTWNKITSADGYQIYRSTAKGKVKLVKTVSKTKTSWKSNKLKKGTAYKYYIVAYKKAGTKKTVIAKSPVIYATTNGNRYTNPKSISITKKTVTLKKGKQTKITARISTGKKTVKKYTAKVRYISSNPSVATVNKNGKITAKAKGTAIIYCYTQNGLYKKVRVTI